jgi:hypothetical protein
MREACPWLRTWGVVDHRKVDVPLRVTPATEEVKSSIWLTIGVSTLSSVARR